MNHITTIFTCFIIVVTCYCIIGCSLQEETGSADTDNSPSVPEICIEFISLPNSLEMRDDCCVKIIAAVPQIIQSGIGLITRSSRYNNRNGELTTIQNISIFCGGYRRLL